MVIDPNKVGVGFFRNADLNPSFFDSLTAQLGYNYAPAFASLRNGVQFGSQIDPNYNWRDDIKGYESYASSLYHATNPQHMATLKQGIDESIQRRQVLSNTSALTSIGIGLLDPINFVALPLGGPTLGFARSALRVGVGTALVETGIEATRQLDPVQTGLEGALNIASAGIFGGALGGVIGGGLNIRASAFQRASQDLTQEALITRRLQMMDGLTQKDVQTPRAQRMYGNMDADELTSMSRHFTEEADRLEAEAQSYRDNQSEHPMLQGLLDTSKEYRDYARLYNNEMAIREIEDLNVDVSDPFRIMDSMYTDSFLYKFVSTPMKRALQSKYPTAVKETFVRSFGDNGITLALNSVGQASPQSVLVRSSVHHGRWVQAQDALMKLWSTETNASPKTLIDINLTDVARRATRRDDTFRNWLRTVSEKRILGAKDFTENEIKAVSILNKYFEDAQTRLEETGLIGTVKSLEKRAEYLEARIEELRQKKAPFEAKMATSNKAQSLVRMVDGELSRITKQVNELAVVKDALDTFAPENVDTFFPRFWDTKKIRGNREKFAETLFRWYRDNPYVYDLVDGEYVKIKLKTDAASIQERVNLSIDRILNEVDPANIDTMSFGHGRSKHFRHRQIDIPNKLVTEFIITDPLAAMKTYAARIEPRYEYAKMFGKSVDSVMFDMELEMKAKGFSEKQINEMRRDYLHMYGRVAGNVLRNPDALNQKVARTVRELASFSYMGSSGLAALPDFGRIVMEFEAEDVVKGIQHLMDKNRVKLDTSEVKLAGEAIDILRGTAHMRMVEDLSNNMDANELLNSTRNAFYILNGLAPFTTIMKNLAGIVDAHTIIDRSIRYSELSPQDLTWMSRYGIDADTAKRIADAPWEKTKDGLYLANTAEWADVVGEETVMRFRAALNSGVLNTVMSATPADKPIIVDGVAYIPSHIGKAFGMAEDAQFKGYSRIENGLMALPFQFYSYMFANVNKTVAALAHGQVKNRLLGVSAAMGLAYMSLYLRTPEFAWEQMTWRDKFARSYDMSGITALYSDIFYTSLHTSLALGGPNVTGGFIAPKFKQEKDPVGALVGFAGAGPSWTSDVVGGAYQFATGEYGEGAKTIVRNLPFARMWFLKDDINQITRAWAQ